VPITFNCKCGQSITVKDEYAGKMGRCPNCKNPVQVPAAGAPAPLRPASGTPGAMPRPGGPSTVRQPPAATPMPLPRPAGATPGAMPRPAPAAKPGGKVTAKLQVVNGPQAVLGKLLPVTAGKPNVIGRDPQADLSIPSDRISRKHCQIEPTPDGLFVLTDLGSSNGTLVNQERIQGRKVLLGGEYIQIGDVLLRFLDQ